MRMGCHALLQGIFPTQGPNPDLLHYRWILYCLSLQGRPWILEWVVDPFSQGTSPPRNQIGVSYTAGAEKTMAPHSSTLAWNIPWTEEPGGLKSMGLLGVGHDWATSFSLFTFMNWRRKWQPTPVFLPGESQGRGSLVGCRLWGRTELDKTEVTWQQQQQQLIIEKCMPLDYRICF